MWNRYIATGNISSKRNSCPCDDCWDYSRAIPYLQVFSTCKQVLNRRLSFWTNLCRHFTHILSSDRRTQASVITLVANGAAPNRHQAFGYHYFQAQVLDKWINTLWTTYIRVFIGPDSDLSPFRHQAIISTNADILSIEPWGTFFFIKHNFKSQSFH